MKSQLSLNELLSSLIAAHQQADEQNQGGAEKSCPVCGMTMEMFRKNALLGCPKDYEIFEQNLQPIIAAVLSVIVVGETFNLDFYIGGVMVLAGVFITQKS